MERDWGKSIRPIVDFILILFSYQNLVRELVKLNESMFLSKATIEAVLKDLHLERRFQLNLDDKMLDRIRKMVRIFFIILLTSWLIYCFQIRKYSQDRRGSLAWEIRNRVEMQASVQGVDVSTKALRDAYLRSCTPAQLASIAPVSFTEPLSAAKKEFFTIVVCVLNYLQFFFL